VLFASELKAFDTAWQPLVDTFPPGHYWTPATGLVPFITIPVPPEPDHTAPAEGDPFDIALSRVRETLTLAVERRLMADVPVGVFLSGGLDSSLIAAIASRLAGQNGQRVKSFAVGLAGSPDLQAARHVADFLGTEHYERVYTEGEALAALPQVIHMMESFDPSLVESAVANYLVAELTARHVKVVLTGEGADELFAGYKYHKGYGATSELHQELVRTVRELHHLNLQRCDRTTMAHGLEARVPFLDLEMINLALSLPITWKLHGPEQTEKWVLRKAFVGYLPEEVLWRKKVQFNEGSGMTEVMRRHVGPTVPADEFLAGRTALQPPLQSREEMAYYRLFKRDFAGVRISAVIGRCPAAFALQ
jgi:asparagine synthase (glutamine-hydrolysing)